MTVSIDERLKCVKCGALTYWDDCLGSAVLCQRCWDNSIEINHYNENHRQEILAYQKAYRENHRQERQKAYRENHRQEILAYQKAYRENHRQERLAFKG